MDTGDPCLAGRPVSAVSAVSHGAEAILSQNHAYWDLFINHSFCLAFFSGCIAHILFAPLAAALRIIQARLGHALLKFCGTNDFEI